MTYVVSEYSISTETVRTGVSVINCWSYSVVLVCLANVSCEL